MTAGRGGNRETGDASWTPEPSSAVPAGSAGAPDVRRIDRVGALAEFEAPDPLISAVRSLREAGYRLLDTYAPLNHDDIEAALDLPRTRLPWAALVAGLVGAGGAYLLQWWIQVQAYPLNVGGRPLHSAPTFIPITVETAILCAAAALFVGYFWRGGMPRLWRPVFEVPGFERATVDRYWVAVDRRDPRYDDDATFQALASLDPPPLRVLLIDDEGVVLREEARP